MAGVYGVSYPTVRLRLDRLIAKIQVVDEQQDVSPFEKLLRTQYAEGSISPNTFQRLWPHTVKNWSEAMMRSIAIGLVMAVCVSTAFAKEVVQEFSWSEAKKTGGLIVGEIPAVRSMGFTGTTENRQSHGQTEDGGAVDLKNPAITSLHYAVEGTVRYENVSARSYLEMWSWFANGGRYFSRTLGESGPTKYLEGSSGGHFRCRSSATRRMVCPCGWSST